MSYCGYLSGSRPGEAGLTLAQLSISAAVVGLIVLLAYLGGDILGEDVRDIVRSLGFR